MVKSHRTIQELSALHTGEAVFPSGTANPIAGRIHREGGRCWQWQSTRPGERGGGGLNWLMILQSSSSSSSSSSSIPQDQILKQPTRTTTRRPVNQPPRVRG